MDIVQEYDRVYHNLDTCLHGLEEVCKYAESKKDKILGNIIENVLSKLIQPPRD